MDEKTKTNEDSFQDQDNKDIDSITSEELSDPKIFRKKSIKLIKKWLEINHSKSSNIYKEVNILSSRIKYILYVLIIMIVLLGIIIVKLDSLF